ncbi:hypothetical protein [Streptomyces sp. NPDC023327]|uniref:hypothetical protein n=1 Tax=Streptomyces sp. NPDC023327 TaxID=3157088 RepID=UPI0033C3C4CD
MSEQTLSQAEGEREQDTASNGEQPTSDAPEPPRTTPSQAEGEDTDEEDRESVEGN